MDYTGSATRLFADPDFDGDPALITEEKVDEAGQTIPKTYEIVEDHSVSAETVESLGPPIITVAQQPEADSFDLLCHLAFNAPLRTRRERADRLRREQKDLFDQYGPEAKSILNDLLEKYSEHGTAQFVIPDVLRLPPISEHGNVIEIAGLFGGAERLRAAINQLQALLYAA